MLAHHEGVAAAADIEAVHDMRVGSRRLRAAIGVFAAAFPDPQFSRFEREVKAVTDSLGAARDLDVMLEALERETAQLPEEQRTAMIRLTERLRKQRAQRQHDVSAALRRLHKADLPAMFDKIVQRCSPPPASEERPEEPPDGESPSRTGD
jgi:CHAD domain-containing protein